MKQPSESSRKDLQGWSLLGAAVLLLAVVSLVKLRQDRTQKPGPDNCVGNPKASTAIVIDRSEETGVQTLDEMRMRVAAYVRDSVQDNEMVSIFTVDDSASFALRPLVALCRPRETGSRLTENVRLLEKRYLERFQRPIDSVLALVTGSGHQSPIAQTLIDISLSRYLSSERNSLLVFSDLLENTPRFSLYRCSSPDEVVGHFRASRVGARQRPTFRNTRVYLHIIPRLDYGPIVWQCRDKLWVWFFGDDTGDLAGVELIDLPGGQRPPDGGTR